MTDKNFDNDNNDPSQCKCETCTLNKTTNCPRVKSKMDQNDKRYLDLFTDRRK